MVNWVNLNHERWYHRNIIEQDIISYYAYLPAGFIEKDLSFSFLHQPGGSEGKDYWLNTTEDGKPVVKMTMGMAIGYLPFFLAAHVYALAFGVEATGFSAPYHFAVMFSSVFYYLLGLYFLWRVLRKYFPDNLVWWGLLLLTFGTNVFYYLTLGAGLAHIFGFAIISAFVHYTLVWNDSPKLKTTLIIGVLLGLMTLVRPVNLLLLIFFVLFSLFASTKERTEIPLKKMLLHLLLMGICGFVIFIPQMLYWKFATGHYLFNSYIGEKFYFGNPHVFNGLFSFRKGWLIYTPLMIFALAGIFLLKNNLKRFFMPVLILTAVYIYVCFSWWCWWYGGSFGQRVLIDIYPVLAFPLLASISFLLNARIVVSRAAMVTFGLLVLLNLFQTTQAKYNIIHFDSMTRANYFRVFFTMTGKPDREKYLQHPDYEKAHRGEDEY